MHWESGLVDLLAELFDAGELRWHLRATVSSPQVIAALPEGTASRLEVARAAVSLLSRNGLVNETFFDALEKARPERAAEVQALRQRWRQPSAPPASVPAHPDTLGLLHLTDLHAGQSGARWLWPEARAAFEDDLRRLHDDAGPIDVVLFSGDGTQRAQDKEFDELNRVLDRLLALLTELGSSPCLLAVPGNHDLRRPGEQDHDLLTIKLWSQSEELQRAFWAKAENPHRRLVKKAFKAWSNWWDRRREGQAALVDYKPGLLPGDYCASVAVRRRLLGVAGLNTAFLQLWGGDLEGRLTLHRSQHLTACGDDPAAWANAHDATVILSHHPRSWLDRAGVDALDKVHHPDRVALHLCGHAHAQDLRMVSSFGARERRTLPGGALFGLETWPDPKQAGLAVRRAHGYSVARIAFTSNDRILNVWPREGTLRGDGVWQMIPHPSFDLPKGGHTRPVSLGPSPRKPSPDLVRAPQPPSGPAAPVEAPHIELLDQLMDRSEQWRRLRSALAQPAGHLVVTVAGSVQQDLALFCSRVLYFVNEPHPREGAALHHRVAQVHLRRGGVAARTPREVENRFVYASGRSMGDLASALRSSAEPWLYILQLDHNPLTGLFEQEIGALEGFFTTHLPAAVQGRSAPVRVLLPIQHGTYEGGASRDPLCKRIDQVLGAPTLPTLALPELTIPAWPEVEHQLREDFRITDEALLDIAGAAFQRARAASGASYGTLAQAVLDALQPPQSPEAP